MKSLKKHVTVFLNFIFREDHTWPHLIYIVPVQIFVALFSIVLIGVSMDLMFEPIRIIAGLLFALLYAIFSLLFGFMF